MEHHLCYTLAIWLLGAIFGVLIWSAATYTPLNRYCDRHFCPKRTCLRRF